MNYDYIDAVCGAGKTNFLIEHYVNRIRPSGNKMIISQPTVKLANQTAEKFREHNINVINLNHKVYNNVKAEAAQVLAGKKFEILIISHPTLLELSKRIIDTSDVYLYIDEVPDVVDNGKITLKEHFSMVTSKVIPGEITGDYVELLKRPGENLQKILKSNDDEVNTVLKQMFAPIEARHKTVYAKTATWNDFCAGKAKTLDFFTIVKPQVLDNWKHVTFLGANFTKSMLYMVWKAAGVNFRRSKFAMTLDDVHLSQFYGNRVDIHYLMDGVWSKNYQKETSLFPYIVPDIEKFIKGKYIYALNKEFENDEKIKGLFKNGTIVSTKSHGSNEYLKHKNAVFLAALNMHNQMAQFLEKQFKISKKEIFTALTVESAYQFVMRTALRLKKSDKPIKIVVPSSDLAYDLMSILPGSRVHHLKTSFEFTNKCRTMTPAERQAKKRKIAAMLKTTSFPLIDKQDITFFKSIYDKAGVKYTLSFKEICDIFNEYSSENGLRKDQCHAFNGSGIKITNENARSSILVLDIDKSKVHPSTLAFPFQYLIHTTFSHVEEAGKFSYRIIIPLAAEVDRRMYRLIGEDIISKFNILDVDKRKLSIFSMFYVPSNQSFIHFNYKNPAKDPNSYVNEYVEAVVVAEMTQDIQAEITEELKSSKATEYREQWSKVQRGEGNHGFYVYGLRLMGLGLPIDKIQSILQRDYGISGSNPEDRRNQISSIIRSLERRIGGT